MLRKITGNFFFNPELAFLQLKKKKNWREWLKSLELSNTYGFQILFHCDSLALHSSSYSGFEKVTSAAFSLPLQLMKASWLQCL